jgi:hypothetical protein
LAAEGLEEQSKTIASIPIKSPYAPYQSGGMIKNNTFATDLNIPLFKGEAVLPASVVQAIKQGSSSFAGLGGDGGSVSNYFNISSLVVREEADVERIAKELYNMQTSTLRGMGIR